MFEANFWVPSRVIVLPEMTRDGENIWREGRAGSVELLVLHLTSGLDVLPFEQAGRSQESECLPGRYQCSTPSLFGENSFTCGLPGMGRWGNWRKEGLGRWQQVLRVPECQLSVRSS